MLTYWECSNGARQPGNTTQIEWLLKAAPGRHGEPVIGSDVTLGGRWNLSVELSSSARERGWTELERSHSEVSNSAELASFFREDFYGNRSFRQLTDEPLFAASIVPILVLYIAFMMKSELKIEWNRLCEELADSEWAFNLKRTWLRLVRQVHSWVGRRIDTEKSPLLRGYSARNVSLGSMVITDAIRPGESTAIRGKKRNLPGSPSESSQRLSIFPGTASVQAAQEQPKRWDESQWID